jgi:hypothetical protein
VRLDRVDLRFTFYKKLQSDTPAQSAAHAINRAALDSRAFNPILAGSHMPDHAAT